MNIIIIKKKKTKSSSHPLSFKFVSFDVYKKLLILNHVSGIVESYKEKRDKFNAKNK